MYLYEKRDWAFPPPRHKKKIVVAGTVETLLKRMMAVVVLVLVVWGPKGSVASCRADVLVVRHYSVFYVHSVCSRFSSWGTASGVVGSNKVGRCCSVWTSSSSSGRSISSTSCAAPFAPFGLGAGKQRRLLSGD